MKKIYYWLFVFFILSFVFMGVVFGSQMPEQVRNELLPTKQPTKEEQEIVQFQESINRIIDEEFGSFKRFNEFGIYSFKDEKNNSVIFQFTDKNHPKVKGFEQRLTNSNIDKSKVEIRFVQYSSQELMEISDKIADILSSESIEGFGVGPNELEQKVMIFTDDLPVKLKERLIKEYGDLLDFKPGIHAEYLSRVKNGYNNLAGGIGLNNVCSTTAVGRKGSQYYLITAGHCLNGNNSIVYQNTVAVGRDHHKANNARLDVGLVRITNDNALSYGRYATDYFYEYSGLDATHNGPGNVVINQAVCKVGITTNRTCGTVLYGNMLVDVGGDRLLVDIARTASPSTIFATYGDSGGLVYSLNGKNVLGTVSSGADDYLYFTRIQNTIDYYTESTTDLSKMFVIYRGNPYKIVD